MVGELLAGVLLDEVAGAWTVGGWSYPPCAPCICWKIGAIAPVIGSPSENATSIGGVAPAVRVAHASRFASDAGSSGGLVGTRPGMARGPAEKKLSSGKGAL